MKTVIVPTAREYAVKIGAGLLSFLGTEAAKICTPGKVAIVSDSNVFPLYGEGVSQSLQAAGFAPVHFVFSAGEASKNGETYLRLLHFLAEHRLTRSDLIVALGGGVTGDLAGFAAATYLRGIGYIQVPTTLLAAVDSSVGGKTAIDLPAGKNLCGAFYQPLLVLCDTDALNTLPLEIFRGGCAEIIKYGVLYDPELFSHLEKRGLSFDREAVIARCVELKKNVVTEDEFDRGGRMKLNLGHTLGHSIESKSHFALSHGQAVSIGMAMVARASGCPDDARIEHCLAAFGLPTRTDFTAREIFDCTLNDKKRSGDCVNLIIPRKIGECDIVPTPLAQLLSFIEAGL